MHVTIIMPIRNEAAFITHSLGAVLAQEYPAECMEILVVDGMSDDGTRQIVERLRKAHAEHSIRLLDNPGRIVPTGFNIALDEARGDVIIRVDGHCEISPNYVRRCVELLEETGAECVGGALVTVGEGVIAQSIALAQSSPFGVGGVAFRTGVGEGRHVDTLAFGAYRRELFERIGGFDEELVRNQDDEFNFRLTQGGGRIWLDPSIQSRYYSRSSLPTLWRQYYQYGFYKVRVIQKRNAVPSWRHLVPATFVLALLASLLAASLTRRPRLALIVAGPYALANGAASVATGWGKGAALSLLPLVYAILHLSYGLGFLHGLWYWRDRWQE